MVNKKKLEFLDFLVLLTKWRKSIFINVFIVGLCSLIISFMLPKWYKATAVILPPSNNQGGGLSSLLNSLPLAGLGLGGGGGGETTYMAILKSQTMAKDVIKKFDLQKFYKKQTLTETYLSFYEDFDVQITEENMVSISYEFKDSVKVAQIVNYIVERLGKRSTELMLERAQRTKMFVEKRYFQNLREKDSLSVEMEKFHKKYGIIQFEEQTKALIQASAEIESKLFIKKAEMNAIKFSYGENSPQFKQKEFEYKTLNKQHKELIGNSEEKLNSPFSSLFLPFEELPDLSKQYADLYTNYLLQTKLQEYLLPEYEQAKLQVQKDEPALQVLDKAIPPDKKSKPKKAFIIIGAVFIGLLLHLLFIFLIEHILWLENNDPTKYKKIEKLKNSWVKSK